MNKQQVFIPPIHTYVHVYTIWVWICLLYPCIIRWNYSKPKISYTDIYICIIIDNVFIYIYLVVPLCIILLTILYLINNGYVLLLLILSACTISNGECRIHPNIHTYLYAHVYKLNLESKVQNEKLGNYHSRNI